MHQTKDRKEIQQNKCQNKYPATLYQLCFCLKNVFNMHYITFEKIEHKNIMKALYFFQNEGIISLYFIESNKINHGKPKQLKPKEGNSHFELILNFYQY